MQPAKQRTPINNLTFTELYLTMYCESVSAFKIISLACQGVHPERKKRRIQVH